LTSRGSTGPGSPRAAAVPGVFLKRRLPSTSLRAVYVTTGTTVPLPKMLIFEISSSPASGADRLDSTSILDQPLPLPRTDQGVRGLEACSRWSARRVRDDRLRDPNIGPAAVFAGPTHRSPRPHLVVRSAATRLGCLIADEPSSPGCSVSCGRSFIPVGGPHCDRCSSGTSGRREGGTLFWSLLEAADQAPATPAAPRAGRIRLCWLQAFVK